MYWTLLSEERLEGILTDPEFAAKVDYEGGLLEALLGYGLSSDSLEPGELKDAISELENIIRSPEFNAALDQANYLIGEALDEWEDEDYD